jgi:8-oxo-dGTP pyrophosphatase MutT (NUDIX family)
MSEDLADRLTRAPRDRLHANVRPRDAATLVIVDRTSRKPKVLMGRRHPGHRFMPGKFVFPGGRVEPGDRRMPAYGALDGVTEARLLAGVQRPSAQRARALAMAAIRETYEETGLMLGSDDLGPPDVSIEGPWADFVTQGVFPQLDGIRFIARAITPPRRPKRFDTRFFMAEAAIISRRMDGFVGESTELIELAWVGIREAKALDIPSITGVILEELEAFLAAGMPLHRPVPFYSERHGRFVRAEL